MSLVRFFFNWVDLVLVVVACRFLYKGYQKGLQKELFDCVRMAGVLLISLAYFLRVSRWIQEHSIIPAATAKILSFLSLGFVAYVGIGFLGKILAKMATLQFSSWFEKGANFFVSLFHFGFSVGYILFLTLLVPTPFSHQQVYEKSFFGKRIVRLLLKNYTRVVRIAPVSPQNPTMNDFRRSPIASSLGE